MMKNHMSNIIIKSLHCDKNFISNESYVLCLILYAINIDTENTTKHYSLLEFNAEMEIVKAVTQ